MGAFPHWNADGGQEENAILAIAAAIKQVNRRHTEHGTVAKLAMRQPFVLFKGLTFQNSAYQAHFARDHHNKMLRHGLLRSARITSIPLMVA